MTAPPSTPCERNGGAPPNYLWAWDHRRFEKRAFRRSYVNRGGKWGSCPEIRAILHIRSDLRFYQHKPLTRREVSLSLVQIAHLLARLFYYSWPITPELDLARNFDTGNPNLLGKIERYFSKLRHHDKRILLCNEYSNLCHRGFTRLHSETRPSLRLQTQVVTDFIII